MTDTITKLDAGLVVGCGSIGQRHVSNLSDLGVTNIVGVDMEQTGRDGAMDAGATAAYADLDDAIREHDPEFAIVCVPNHVHVPVSRQLAEAGIDLFVEKPLSHTMDGVSELLETAVANDLVTLVGCNFRFQPGVRTLRDLLQAGAIGTPLSARIEAGSYLPHWHPNESHHEMYSASAKQGGGAILDYIHELNYARWLFGDVAEVTAMTASRSHLNIETEDVGAMILQMADGTLCEVHVDYISRPSSRGCQIVGEDGTLTWNLDRHTVEQYHPSEEEWETHDLTEWEVNEMYVAEMRHFLHCVATRSTSICEIQEGAADLRVALAALRSAETGDHVEPSTFG